MPLSGCKFGSYWEIPMSPRVITVSFLTAVYSSKPAFDVPKDVAKVLGVGNKSRVVINVIGPNGAPVYYGPARLTSGTEVCSGPARTALKKLLGKQITVWVSQP